LFIPVAEEHWIREDLKLEVGQAENFIARIRYRQALQSCALHQKQEGLYIIFDEPQRGITPGQFAAWYSGDELVGSGVID
jgi:tRNA-specific 2-thiouridylase